MPENSNVLMRVLRALWRGIDAARKVFVNLLFLFIVVALLALVFRSDKPDIADTTALVIAPQGRLVEQLTAKSVDQLIDEAQGNAIPETLLKDVLDTIEAAKEDERIEVLVLDLSAFRGGRLTKLQDVVKALEDFRSSGKKVIARADVLEQDGYFLAAHADEIIIHKFGAVILQGFGRYRMYYKEGIDKLGLDVHVFKVGTYKSAVEPFLLDGMSGDAKEANREWLGDLWRIYLDEAAAARGMTAAQLDNYAQNFQPVIAEANGDTAKAALDFGLVDQTMTRIEIRQHLIDLVGEDEENVSAARRRETRSRSSLRAARSWTGRILPARSAATRRERSSARPATTKTSRRLSFASTPEGAARSPRRSFAGSARLRAPPASRSSHLWAASPPRAVSGSARRQTRSGRTRAPSQGPSAFSACLPPTNDPSPSTSGFGSTASALRQLRVCVLIESYPRTSARPSSK
jgi:ClpP class serine protease